jgi:hypothetical protein
MLNGEEPKNRHAYKSKKTVNFYHREFAKFALAIRLSLGARIRRDDVCRSHGNQIYSWYLPRPHRPTYLRLLFSAETLSFLGA